MNTSTVVHPLPSPASRFVGRERELADIKQLLVASRLVTLMGVGGVGKTRLALALAHSLQDTYAQGVFFVPLAPLTAVVSLAPTIAKSLGFALSQSGEPKQQLLDYLREKQLLLVLDNFDQLIEGATLVSDILQTAPQVHILVTSRERLHLQEEQLYVLQGLNYPAEGVCDELNACEALQLFVQCAWHVQPDFAFTAQNAPHVTRICQLVQGLPLGIELAATWLEALTPAEIAAELTRSANFLMSTWRDVPERHHSLRAVFDYSWNLLRADEQRACAQLSVFRGGFTREAAEAVTGASMQLLLALVNKSLLYHQANGRYELHELVRQYAAERLKAYAASAPANSTGLAEEMEARHSAYYLDFLARRATDLQGQRQLEAMAEIESDLENARVAWYYAIAQRQYVALSRAMDSLAMFYVWRVRFVEGAELCRRVSAQGEVVERDASQRLLLAKAARWQGHFCYALDRPAEAKTFLQQSLALLESCDASEVEAQRTRAWVWLGLARIFSLAGERSAQRQFIEQSLALYRTLDDQWGTASAMSLMGHLTWRLGHFEESRQWFEQSANLQRAMGNRFGLIDSLAELGNVTAFLGRGDETERIEREALALCRELNDRSGMETALGELATVLVTQGRFAEGLVYYTEEFELACELGLRGNAAMDAGLVGSVYMILQDYPQALAWGQRGLALSKDAGFERGVAYALFVLGSTYLGLENYAQAEPLLRESVAIYRRIRMPDLVFALLNLVLVERQHEQYREAWHLAHEALQTLKDTHAPYLLLQPLRVIAVLLADRGDKERAVELYTLLRRYPFIRHNPHSEKLCGSVVDAAAKTLPPRFAAAARARGEKMDLQQTVQQLLAEWPTLSTPAIKQEYPAGLTTREIEVLRCLAMGLSNPEIAKQLVISARTVDAHLRSIFNKLDVTTRAAAVRVAIENKLV